MAYVYNLSTWKAESAAILGHIQDTRLKKLAQGLEGWLNG